MKQYLRPLAHARQNYIIQSIIQYVKQQYEQLHSRMFPSGVFGFHTYCMHNMIASYNNTKNTPVIDNCDMYCVYDPLYSCSSST